LRITSAARAFLFQGARLWADTKRGDFAGKVCLLTCLVLYVLLFRPIDLSVIRVQACEWTDVSLVIYPHGAVLSFAVDWLSGFAGGAFFTLADMRTWIYVGKFCAVKVVEMEQWAVWHCSCGDGRCCSFPPPAFIWLVIGAQQTVCCLEYSALRSSTMPAIHSLQKVGTTRGWTFAQVLICCNINHLRVIDRSGCTFQFEFFLFCCSSTHTSQ
jgi:hypothetical protein